MADTRDCLNVRLDGPDGSRIAWVVADPVDGAGWTTALVETVERLLPHLRQFVRVRQALADARGLGSTVSALLENTRCGVIQLDHRGRIVAVNDFARDLLRKRDGLADRDGLLWATFAEDDRALQALLARVLPRFGGQGESGSITLRRRAVSPRLVLHASPVGGAAMEARPSRVAAMVLVVDPASRGNIDPALVRAMLGLTQAGKPYRCVAGPELHHPRHRRRDGPERGHNPLARQAGSGQARHLPANGAGAPGSVVVRHSAAASLTRSTPARRPSGFPTIFN